MHIRVESEETIHCRRNEHDEGNDDKRIETGEDGLDGLVPPKLGMHCPQNPLREDSVDSKEQDHPSGDKNSGCDADVDIGLPVSPYDTHDAGCNSRHAKTEEHAGKVEFVAAAEVNLENCHVADGANNEERHEDCGDRRVNTVVWETTQGSILGWIWGT